MEASVQHVEIYTTPTCHFCKLAKAFFEENDIPYTEHDVMEDVEKRHEMIDRSQQMGVPVIVVDDEITVGFDKSRLESLLGVETKE